MSDAPISAPEREGETALLEAARAFERGEHETAAVLWRERAVPAVRRDWPAPLSEAVREGLELAMAVVGHAVAIAVAERAVSAWDAVGSWLASAELPLGGGRSTPAHFRKHKRDPQIYRGVALAEHVRLADAGRAVALNNHALVSAELGREEEALSLLRRAASLRQRAFGWREAGLGVILANVATIEGTDAAPPEDPVPVGVNRFLAVAQGQPELRRQLIAAAELVPILRRPTG